MNRVLKHKEVGIAADVALTRRVEFSQELRWYHGYSSFDDSLVPFLMVSTGFEVKSLGVLIRQFAQEYGASEIKHISYATRSRSDAVVAVRKNPKYGF